MEKFGLMAVVIENALDSNTESKYTCNCMCELNKESKKIINSLFKELSQEELTLVFMWYGIEMIHEVTIHQSRLFQSKSIYDIRSNIFGAIRTIKEQENVGQLYACCNPYIMKAALSRCNDLGLRSVTLEK
jgi:hypothetical protein